MRLLLPVILKGLGRPDTQSLIAESHPLPVEAE